MPRDRVYRKKVHKAPRGSDRYWRFPHMWTALSGVAGRLIFDANNSERFRTLPGLYTIEKFRKVTKNNETWWKLTKIDHLKKSISARWKSLKIYTRPRLDTRVGSRASKPGASVHPYTEIKKSQSTRDTWNLFCIMVTFLQFRWKSVDYTPAKYAQNASKHVKNSYVAPLLCPGVVCVKKTPLRERSTCADFDQKSAKFMICQQNPRSGDP